MDNWLEKEWKEFYEEYYKEFECYLRPINDQTDSGTLMTTSFFNGAMFALNIVDAYMRYHERKGETDNG